jgi:hypothetical protein
MFTQSQETISSWLETADDLKKRYSTSQHLPCEYCGFLFPNAPYFIPINFDRDTYFYIPTGRFCSPGCALAQVCYSKEFGGHLQQQIQEDLMYVWKTQYGLSIRQIEAIQPSPPKRDIHPAGKSTASEIRNLNGILPQLDIKKASFATNLVSCTGIVSELKKNLLQTLPPREDQKEDDSEATQVEGAFVDFMLRTTALPKSTSFGDAMETIRDQMQPLVVSKATEILSKSTGRKKRKVA